MGPSQSNVLGIGEWRGYIDLVCRRATLVGRAPTLSCYTLVMWQFGAELGVELGSSLSVGDIIFRYGPGARWGEPLSKQCIWSSTHALP